MPQWWPFWGESSNVWLSRLIARCCGKNNKRAVLSTKTFVASISRSSLKEESYQSRRPSLRIVLTSKGPTVCLPAHKSQALYQFARPLIRWRDASEHDDASQPVPGPKKPLVTKAVLSSKSKNVINPSSKRHEPAVVEIAPSLAAQFPFLHSSELREAFPSY